MGVAIVLGGFAAYIFSGGTAISGGGTPDTGGGTPFRPVPAEFNHCLGHVTPKFFGMQSNISLKLLELGTSNLVHIFGLGKPSGHTNNFSQEGRGLGHVTTKFSGKRSQISSKLFELETSNLVRSFVFRKPSGRGKKIFLEGACRRSRDH